jgi:CheY-like chemotaxis protein
MKEGSKILLVDNNESSQDIFKKIAKELNCNLIIAEDGQEGLDIAGEELPDLIAVRRKASVLDALSMSVLLKQSDKTKDIPILVICTDVSNAELASFKDAGCSGCIKEPFAKKELIEKIEEILS